MKPIATITVIALAVGLSGCVPPPKEAGEAKEAEAKAKTEHQTAGLTGEISNGKVDETMEGSGNLGWQGSLQREKRAKALADAGGSEKPTEPRP